MRQVFAGSFVLLGLVLIGCNRDNPPKGDGAKTKSDPTKPAFVLTAEDFTKEFIADARAAGDKYAYKVVELTGEVGDVAATTIFYLKDVQGKDKAFRV